MLKEFKKFIMRGNMIDLAVGVIIGTAFSALVSSLVNDIFMPVLGKFTGGMDFSNNFLVLSNPDNLSIKTLAEAVEAGIPVLAYGKFVTGLLQFLIMAFIVFLMVRSMNKIAELGKKKEVPAAPTTKVCPFCQSEISIKATRCPHCTSELPEEVTQA